MIFYVHFKKSFNQGLRRLIISILWNHNLRFCMCKLETAVTHEEKRKKVLVKFCATWIRVIYINISQIYS